MEEEYCTCDGPKTRQLVIDNENICPRCARLLTPRDTYKPVVDENLYTMPVDSTGFELDEAPGGGPSELPGVTVPDGAGADTPIMGAGGLSYLNNAAFGSAPRPRNFPRVEMPRFAGGRDANHRHFF